MYCKDESRELAKAEGSSIHKNETFERNASHCAMDVLKIAEHAYKAESAVDLSLKKSHVRVALLSAIHVANWVNKLYLRLMADFGAIESLESEEFKNLFKASVLAHNNLDNIYFSEVFNEHTLAFANRRFPLEDGDNYLDSEYVKVYYFSDSQIESIKFKVYTAYGLQQLTTYDLTVAEWPATGEDATRLLALFKKNKYMYSWQIIYHV